MDEARLVPPVDDTLLRARATALENPLVHRTLVTAEFLYEQALHPEAQYTFKHPLTQEVAYHSQLGAHRARLHGRVARAIQELYPDKLDERAALVAHHLEQSGETLDAARGIAERLGGPVFTTTLEPCGTARARGRSSRRCRSRKK